MLEAETPRFCCPCSRRCRAPVTVPSPLRAAPGAPGSAARDSPPARPAPPPRSPRSPSARPRSAGPRPPPRTHPGRPLLPPPGTVQGLRRTLGPRPAVPRRGRPGTAGGQGRWAAAKPPAGQAAGGGWTGARVSGGRATGRLAETCPSPRASGSVPITSATTKPANVMVAVLPARVHLPLSSRPGCGRGGEAEPRRTANPQRLTPRPPPPAPLPAGGRASGERRSGLPAAAFSGEGRESEWGCCPAPCSSRSGSPGGALERTEHRPSRHAFWELSAALLPLPGPVLSLMLPQAPIPPRFFLSFRGFSANHHFPCPGPAAAAPSSPLTAAEEAKSGPGRGSKGLNGLVQRLGRQRDGESPRRIC